MHMMLRSLVDMIIYIKCVEALGVLRVSEYSDIHGSEYKIEYEYSSLLKSLDRDLFFFFFLPFCYWNKKFFTKWSIEIFHFDYGSNWQYLLFKYLCFLQVRDILYR